MGFRELEREVARGWDMWRAVWSAEETRAGVRFLPSRGLGVLGKCLILVLFWDEGEEDAQVALVC